MATVRMVRGELYADIYDSPETIEQAKKDGFVQVPMKQVSEKPSADEAERQEPVNRQKRK